MTPVVGEEQPEWRERGREGRGGKVRGGEGRGGEPPLPQQPPTHSCSVRC